MSSWLAWPKLGRPLCHDAFAILPRKHGSMFGVARPSKPRAAPPSLATWLKKRSAYLHEAVSSPKRPFVAILGGAKVSDKIKLISNLLGKVDNILIGGAMAYTLLKASGATVGKSRVEEDQVEEMKKLLGQAAARSSCPAITAAASAFDFKAMTGDKPTVVAGANIPDGLMGMDIGPKTIKAFSDIIGKAGTIVWNGPMGVFEAPTTRPAPWP